MDVDVIDQIFFWFFFLLLRSVPLFRGVCRLSVVLYMLYVLCVSLLVYWWKKSSGSKRWCRRGVCLLERARIVRGNATKTLSSSPFAPSLPIAQLTDTFNHIVQYSAFNTALRAAACP